MEELTVVDEELAEVLAWLETEEDLVVLPLLPGCSSVFPINVFDCAEEPTGFAGYEGGPNDGELEDVPEDDLDDEDELDERLEDAEVLPPGSLSAEE